MTSTIQCAAGKREITPELPVVLARFGGQQASRVSDPLEVNAVVVRCDGKPFIFVSSDVLYISNDIRRQVLEQVRKTEAIEEEDLFWGATHTHYAPAVDPMKEGLGEVDLTYLDYFIDETVGLLTDLLTGPSEPVRVSYVASVADLAVNRRKTVWYGSLLHREVRNYPNPKGPRDSTLHGLVFRNESGSVSAVVWSWACHPTSHYDRTQVSADFPGRVRARLRQLHNDDTLPVLYYQGFSGDLRPNELDRRLLARPRVAQLNRLVHGPRFAAPSPESFSQWTGRVADAVEVAFLGPAEVEPRFATGRASIPLSELLDGPVPDDVFTVHAVEPVDGVVMIGISAEVVTQYTDVVKRAFDGKTVVPVGCVDGTYGYLPTEKMIGEGGYEAERFFGPLGLGGCTFKSGLERKIEEILDRVAAELGSGQ